MADNLLIIMANADLEDAARLATPLFQATVAAAMEYGVEVILSGPAARLALKNVAAEIALQEGGAKSLYDLIREAHQGGVRFKACLTSAGQENPELIPEVEETVGDAYGIAKAMAENTVTFTY